MTHDIPSDVDGESHDEDQRVDSTSDSRTANNTMRHQYRVLSDAEKQHMSDLKDAGIAFLKLLHKIGETPQDGDRYASRELSLAATKMEEAVMWSVKHVTK